MQSISGFSTKYRRQLDSFFMQDRDDAFIFRVRCSMTDAIIMAYYKAPNDCEIFVGKFDPYSVDRFVKIRNEIYLKYGLQPVERVFEGGENTTGDY